MALALPASEPAAAPFRSAFLAQFPKAEATAAALELERIAATLGLDLVPKEESLAPPAEGGPKETEARPKSFPINGNQRSRPAAEEIAAYQQAASSVSEFVERELKTPEERIGAPPAPSERFLSDHEGAMAAVESVLLRGAEVQWEMDVTQGHTAPIPNIQGQLRLQKLLVARALIEARRGETENALQTLEASWRFNETLSSRPEFISQLIVVAIAKLQAGALRKLDTPVYGWADRLRSQSLFSGFLAAFQNQVWYSNDVQDLTGEAGAFGRILRQVAEEFQRRDLCWWTPEKLQEAWNLATREQDDPTADYRAPNLMRTFERWRHYLIDVELTALILDARAERAASRQQAWPEKLLSVGRGVCPDAGWSYRPSAKGTATFAFEGRIVEDEGVALRLPLTFTAGVPVSPATQTTKPTPKPTPRAEREKLLDGERH